MRKLWFCTALALCAPVVVQADDTVDEVSDEAARKDEVTDASPFELVRHRTELIEARYELARELRDRREASCLIPYVRRARMLAWATEGIEDSERKRADVRIDTVERLSERLVEEITPLCGAGLVATSKD